MSKSPEQGGPGGTGGAPAPRNTPQGAPTDAAHQEAGDGSLTGSTPAGLTADELDAEARSDKTDDAATS